MPQKDVRVCAWVRGKKSEKYKECLEIINIIAGMANWEIRRGNKKKEQVGKERDKW